MDFKESHPATVTGRMRYRLALLLVPLALLAGVAWFALKEGGGLGVLLRAEPPLLLGLLFSGLPFLALQGLLLSASLRPFGVHLPPFKALELTAASLLANYLIPFSGVGARALYLKSRYGLGVSEFTASQGGVLAVELLVYGLAGISILLTSQQWQGAGLPALLLLSGLVAALLAVLLIPPLPWFPKKLRAVHDAWHHLRANRPVLLRIACLTVAMLLANLAVFWFSLAALGLAPLLSAAGMAAVLSDFAFLIRLAPGAAGTYEGAVVYAGHLFGIGAADGLALAILTRLVVLLWCLALAPGFAWRAIRGQASDQ